MPALRHKKTSFSFKQFIVEQDNCAMKVCTDACILGAFVEVKNAEKILDIGTGTGLLALMMAQRMNNTKAHIDAIEIDESAYSQAVRNVKNSNFKEKITIFYEKIQAFSSDEISKMRVKQTPKSLSETSSVSNPKSQIPNPKSYDLIVSNPPFYQNSLQSLDSQANTALHAIELTFEELINAVVRLLQSDGRFVVLLPPFETEQLTAIAAKAGFYVNHQLCLRHDESKPIFRMITTFTRKQLLNYSNVILTIWDKNGKYYSKDFRQLLQDYYTIF